MVSGDRLAMSPNVNHPHDEEDEANEGFQKAEVLVILSQIERGQKREEEGDVSKLLVGETLAPQADWRDTRSTGGWSCEGVGR
jgi:hypothetical protein